MNARMVVTSPRWRRLTGPGSLAIWTLLGVCLVLARQVEYGVGLDFDSADYVNAARNLRAGEPLLLHDREHPCCVQPLLYPALLVVAGFDPLDVAGPLNAALFGTMVWICGAFLRRRLATRPVWAQCGCAAVAISPSLVDSAATAMPTTTFALLVACTLICVAERDHAHRFQCGRWRSRFACCVARRRLTPGRAAWGRNGVRVGATFTSQRTLSKSLISVSLWRVAAPPRGRRNARRRGARRR